jgi:hypothetical protein
MKALTNIIILVFIAFLCFASCKTPAKTLSNEKKEQIDRDKKGFEQNMKETEEKEK